MNNIFLVYSQLFCCQQQSLFLDKEKRPIHFFSPLNTSIRSRAIYYKSDQKRSISIVRLRSGCFHILFYLIPKSSLSFFFLFLGVHFLQKSTILLRMTLLKKGIFLRIQVVENTDKHIFQEIKRLFSFKQYLPAELEHCFDVELQIFPSSKLF